MLEDAIVLDPDFLRFNTREKVFRFLSFFSFFYFILVWLRPRLPNEIRTIYVSSGFVEMLKEAVFLDPDFLRFKRFFFF